MTKTEENKIITEAIEFLTYGQWAERRKYVHDALSKGAKINGYTFQQDTWCWLIWKPTDISKNPEFKGEPLVKVVPFNIEMSKIEDVLNAQAWSYM